RLVKGLVHPGRNGYLWRRERRADGIRFVDAKPFVTQEVFTKIDPVSGRPSYDPERKPRSGAAVTFCPGLWGGKDWTPAGYNPKTNYLYIPANENLCSTLVGQAGPYEPGKLFLGIDRPKTTMSWRQGASHIGELQAWDMATGQRVWTHKFPYQNWGPILTTGGGLRGVGVLADGLRRTHMAFNVFEHFKGFERTSEGPRTPEEQGTRFFLGGHLGPRISEHLDASATKAGLSRRTFLASASALPAAMLAVNNITGMRFFDVTPAEAYEPAAAKEIKGSRKPGSDFILDAHTHICTRKDGYIPGINTTERGMWFVQLLDDLGKAMGLPNGTKDMTVENFGKLILEGSDTSVAVFNPFGFREDYGG